MDRGVGFKLVAHYMESFSYRESPSLSDLKLEFLTIICEHEHFIPLNLPFPVSAAEMEFSVSDEYYRKHFLMGVLLREVESALQYEAGPVRKRTIRILRDLLAKHDCDSRYKDPGQMRRIAQLCFPLVPIVLSHVSRLNSGQPPYISPMLGAAAAMHRVQEDKSEVCHTDSLPPSLPGSLPSTLERGVDPAVMSSVKSLTSVELAAAMGHRSTP
ncbi:Dedicator of cytokinesis protein 11, partial [Geodia barretti]